MEQHSDSTVNMVSSSTQNPSNIGVAVAPATQDVTSEHRRDSASNKTVTLHQLPIPPASEPMQYRAIGLIKGTYVPSEEQFTRGMVTTENNETIDAVLLGRVMSLVKKHVDLTVPHLWVVYPRTRPKDEHLHAQIVGIWEPDNLNRDSSPDLSLSDEDETDVVVEADAPQEVLGDAIASSDEAGDASEGASDVSTDHSEDEISNGDATAAASEPSADPEVDPTLTKPNLVKPSRPKVSAKMAQAGTEATAPQRSSEAIAEVAVPDMTDGYFSIRGEVIQFSPEDEQITVRIKQAKRKSAKAGDKNPKGGDESKEFKLQLKGRLDGRVVGYFWDLHARRDGNDLVVTDSTMIKMVPPQKKRHKKFGGRGGGRGGAPRRRDGGGHRPMRSGDRPTPSSPTRRGPASKPVLKKSVAKDSDASPSET